MIKSMMLNELGAGTLLGMRGRRVVGALGAAFFLATFMPPPAVRNTPAGPADAMLTFSPLPLYADAPDRLRVGKLLYLGGWQLDSAEPRFGGISAMHVEYGRVIAVSDAGALFGFALPAQGRETKLTIRPLPFGPGSGVEKADRDSESLLIRGSQAWIAFEGSNSVWRYRLSDWRMEAVAAPPAMKRWPANGGSEALVRLEDGRFLVFSELAAGPGGATQLLLFDGDPAEIETGVTKLGYRAPAGHRVTDAALLPDGRLLLLNRRVTLLGGISATLTIADLSNPAAGSVIEGAEVARLESPMLVDNMEALSITREGRRTILWIASDDNFSPLQRTLLLKFALVS